MSRGARPPRLAEGLLTAVIGVDARCEGVLGDLHEEFLREVERAPIRAPLWYWIASRRGSPPRAHLRRRVTLRIVCADSDRKRSSLAFTPEIP